MASSLIGTIPFSKEQVAIAMCHSEFGGGHIGIAFHTPKDGPKVLHLAWHHQLKVQKIPDELNPACWIADALLTPNSASKQIVAYVRVVASRLATIKYGINFVAAKGSFLANGSYKPPKGSDGLTCSSFVVEVLRGCQINLIREDTWVEDAENSNWGESVCISLQHYGVDAEHIEAVRKNINGLRLRPFEVAGAAQIEHKLWPVDFTTAKASSANVSSALSGLCPQAPA